MMAEKTTGNNSYIKTNKKISYSPYNNIISQKKAWLKEKLYGQ